MAYRGTCMPQEHARQTVNYKICQSAHGDKAYSCKAHDNKAYDSNQMCCMGQNLLHLPLDTTSNMRAGPILTIHVPVHANSGVQRFRRYLLECCTKELAIMPANPPVSSA